MQPPAGAITKRKELIRASAGQAASPLAHAQGRNIVATLKGNKNNDLLIGTEFDDTIDGGGGDDVLQGLGGNDNLIGGAGSDLLDGGSGDDVLEGGSGDDALLGGEGNDLLDGGAGDDVLDGGAGNDSLIGGAGSDFLDGGAGIDHLSGGAGADILLGGEGEDELIGGGGADLLDGGSGADFLNGGAGTDTASYRNSQGGVTVNLDTGIGSGGDAEGDQLILIEDLEGSAFNDTLIGDDGANVLDGGAGDDLLDGRSGDNVFRYDAFDGNDTIVVADETLSTDTLEFAAAIERKDVQFGQSGDDLTIRLSSAFGSGVITVQGFFAVAGSHRIDTIAFDGGADLMDVSLFTQLSEFPAPEVTVIGDDGDNVIVGGIGNDTLDGGAGNDQIDAGDGNDLVLGGAGNDTLLGGLGDDTLTGGPGSDTFIHRGEGDGLDTLTDFNRLEDVTTIHMDGTGSSYTFDPATNTLGLVTTGEGFIFGGTSDSPDEVAFRGTEVVFSGGGELRSGEGNLEGTASDDLLMRFGIAPEVFDGNGFILAGEGDDRVLDLSTGASFIDGGVGNDHIEGGAGDDFVAQVPHFYCKGIVAFFARLWGVGPSFGLLEAFATGDIKEVIGGIRHQHDVVKIDIGLNAGDGV